MDLPAQTLPAGWRLEARSPTSTRFEDCAIRITSPNGEVVEYLARPYQVECEVTRQLAEALGTTQSAAAA